MADLPSMAGRQPYGVETMRISILNIALGQYGHKEVLGEKDNPEILKYFNDLGFDGSQLKDETAWCAAFANWVLLQAGIPGTNKLNAKSFLDIGEKTDTPALGDLVVLWRVSPNDWRGHVGFFIRESETHIHILGGNQNNQVCIRPYPKKRLKEYRKVA